MLAAIELFLASTSQPVLIEAGDVELSLVSGCFSLENSAGSLRLHAWSNDRSYTRRIVGVNNSKPGRLELKVARLGRPDGVATIFDAAHLGNAEIRRKGRRETNRERFRMMLSRQYTGWKIAELTTAPDLEHSLSPSYPRALLRQGTSAIAAIYSPEEALDHDGALTFGLIWLDYLRKRKQRLTVSTLAIFLPEMRATNTALRIRCLNQEAAELVLFVTGEAGEQRVDPHDWGNLTTTLDVPPPSRIIEHRTPEAELERIIRSNIRALDAALEPNLVYRQTPAIAGMDRGILDLLAIDVHGRLAVIELKATQDIHLPLQALDYWMRVRWHLKEGDFDRFGYFPQSKILRVPPILYLAAPALEFHPSTDTILRFFDPAISVVRLGIGANWKCDLKVISRQERHEHSSATA